MLGETSWSLWLFDFCIVGMVVHVINPTIEEPKPFIRFGIFQ